MGNGKHVIGWRDGAARNKELILDVIIEWMPSCVRTEKARKGALRCSAGVNFASALRRPLAIYALSLVVLAAALVQQMPRNADCIQRKNKLPGF